MKHVCCDHCQQIKRPDSQIRVLLRGTVCLLCTLILLYDILPGKSIAASDYNSYIYSTNKHWLANCADGENGESGQTPGDQTRYEYHLSEWDPTLSNGEPWHTVFRYPNSAVAMKIAELGIDAALNDHIGYDWGYPDRETYWNELSKVNFDASAITVDCEADCSSAVCTNVKAAGYIYGIDELKNVRMANTASLTEVLTTAGFIPLTGSMYCAQKEYLLPGDILLANGHTLINVTKGSQAVFKDLADDHTAPILTQSIVESVTPNGITVLCAATDDTFMNTIKIGVWHSEMIADNAEWYSARVQNNQEVRLFIPFSDFGNKKEVTYYINVYAWDYAGNFSITSRPVDVYVESTPPTVTSARIENITPLGYDVVCTATDNTAVSSIRIGSWYDNMNIDNAVWQEVNSDGSSTVIHVNVADFSFAQNTTYHTNVFACDSSGNYSEAIRAGDPFIERDLTGIAEVKNISASGYDLVFSVASYPSAAGVRVGTWHDQMNIDNAVWQDLNSPTGTIHISTADFGNAVNVVYHTNAYILAASGRYSDPFRAVDILIENTPPVVTSASVENITPEGYDIRCNASDNSKVSRIRVGTWHDQMSIDDAVWQNVWNPDGEAVIHVSISDFGGKRDVTYHSNVFAFDECNNVSEAVRAGDPYITEDNHPSVTSAAIIDSDYSGYTVKVCVSDDIALQSIGIMSWNDVTGRDAAVYQSVDVSGKTGEATFTVLKSELGGYQNTEYHTEVWAMNSSGHYSLEPHKLDIMMGIDLFDSRVEGLTMYLPGNTAIIESEAFNGVSAQYFVLPSGVTSIQAGAFPSGSTVYLYGEGISISNDLFGGVGTIVEMSVNGNTELANQLMNTPVSYILRNGDDVPGQTEN